ncbi:acriflavine resistance protein B [Alteromonas sp. KUL42]|uniref:efflux RND transporter permease subunit n=1 Tax=Alteromonas sp. KUL42 TaxID=2480797 RepID=UPI001035B56B|nr:efflux RND transporter permease subunit [Alteromonas sp. KUL42]TAP33058.1 efflux RND transporter permease subunit [Alteromonas sp. KUL42]GEA08656.1 acriflavine resistance protein B [Alteromonas sp. KUL42]
MDITRAAIKNATGVGIGITLLVFLGLYSLFNLPVQLFPDIERPNINIQTSWRAASPQEIESEIIEPQEEVLQGIPGLESMSAWSNQGNAWINLEFSLGTDMQKTLIEVISRMNRVPPLPRDALSPNIMLAGSGGDAPALTYFFLQRLPGNPNEINSYVTYFTDVIKPQLESIPGVARARMESGVGGVEEFQIVFDPFKAAQLGIDLTAVANELGRANDISGGFVDVGRRRYTLRFEGRYQPAQMGEMILEWRNGSPITLNDIAEIKITRADGANYSVQNGNPAISIRVDRQNNANVLATLEAVKAKVAEINEKDLAAGQLVMAQSFDASVFIYRAVQLVTSNLFIGVLLAIGILWLFMRQLRATLIVALAIPISLLSTFVVLQITGRSLNIISLAGLAFAVGMVLDAAIVVLENIVRTRKSVGSDEESAHKGTKEVFGALMASTATTVAIFIPVMFLEDVEGQLFADLALTIAIAVCMSLVVAVTVLPVVAARYLNGEMPEDSLQRVWAKVTKAIMKLSSTPLRRVLMVLTLMGVPITGSVLMMPSMDYLPPVKRDAVDAFLMLPAGASENFISEEVIPVIVERLKPYMDGEKQPALKNYYIITWPNGGTLGVRAKDQSKVKELEAIVRDEILKDLPDTQAFAQQGNLFGGFGNGRSINIHLQGVDQDMLGVAAQAGLDKLREVFPNANARSNPPLEQSEPELRFSPNDSRMMEVGLNRGGMGNLVRAMGDGMYVGEYFDGVKRMNIIFRSEPWLTPEDLGSTPIMTPVGEVVQLNELVDIQRAVGPSRIQRIDGRRTLTLNVNPPEGMSLEETMKVIQAEVEPAIMAMMPTDGSIAYGGSAGSLKGAISSMTDNFLFAMVLLLLLMAGLFKSLKDSVLVVLSIPLATVGGVLAIRIMNVFTFQPMDLLTMIGFIILLGLVVNNAILLVHQTRLGEQDGLTRDEAVEQAIQLRLRPIFMSTLTSIFGMLPLLLMPGAGSVIYRGLAAVIVGGMTVSTIFTLLLLPTLLRMTATKKTVEIKNHHVGGLTPQSAKLDKHSDHL